MVRGLIECKKLEFPINLVYATNDELTLNEIKRVQNLTDNVKKAFETANLSDREKEVLMGYFYNRYTLAKIAKAYNITVERVRQIMHYALRKLSKCQITIMTGMILQERR